MLEWMHEPAVVEFMRADFASKTLADCEAFIEASRQTEENLHLAVVNEEDAYLGTVSLKQIKNGRAEFGITVRSCAQGTGAAHWGMEEILRLGLQERGLSEVYWCVDPANVRAVRFYDKYGYVRFVPEGEILRDMVYTEKEISRYTWYHVTA